VTAIALQASTAERVTTRTTILPQAPRRQALGRILGKQGMDVRLVTRTIRP
jgi:hypothetical protein